MVDRQLPRNLAGLRAPHSFSYPVSGCRLPGPRVTRRMLAALECGGYSSEDGTASLDDAVTPFACILLLVRRASEHRREWWSKAAGRALIPRHRAPSQFAPP